MPEDKKIDPDTGKEIEPEDKTGAKKPEDKTGEEKKPDYSQMTDEELDELIAKEGEEREAEVLGQAGLGKFKNFQQLIKGYSDLDTSDQLVFPKIKKLAQTYNMTPEDFIAKIETQLGKQKEAKKQEPPVKPTGPSPLEVELGQTQLDMRFLKFQQRMAKDEVEIPDELQPVLEELLPKVLYGQGKEELKKTDWFGEAYDLYLFNLSKAKSPEELEGDLAVHREAMRRKRKQLGIPDGTKSKKKTQTEIEEEKTWGAGFKNLPEPSKK